LEDLAKRSAVAPAATLAGTELALTERWLRDRWTSMTSEARAALWEQLGIQPPAPPDGDAALAVLKEKIPAKRLAYVATTAGAALLRFIPLSGCFVLYWVARPKDEVLLPAIVEVARLRQAVVHRITVGLVGSPSSGKDAANKALFGIDKGNVSPIAGSTREVEITRLPNATALFVVNTPGLGDVVERVTEEARQVLDHIDVFVYLVNAQGGVQAREKADYALCRASGRPVLVVLNKVDTLREADRIRLLDDTRTKLGATDIIAAAFDPLPALSAEPIGLGEVQAWIRDRLTEAGKDPSELPW
ncbi:MAG: 50S ribosome-binding GTPase, partial [Deltaproteobacteria bacterium]|nr:50S ribosome-binding GTPase [Deltaproteobacteria bacterium]